MRPYLARSQSKHGKHYCGQTFLDVISTDQFLKVESQALRCDILGGSSIDGAGDEPGDKRYVHHVREVLAQGNDTDRDVGKTEQRDYRGLHTMTSGRIISQEVPQEYMERRTRADSKSIVDGLVLFL